MTMTEWWVLFLVGMVAGYLFTVLILVVWAWIERSRW